MKRLFAIAVLLTVVFTIPPSVQAGKWVDGLYAKSITNVLTIDHRKQIKGRKKGCLIPIAFGVADFSGDGRPEILYGGHTVDCATNAVTHLRAKTVVISRSARGKFSLYQPMMRVMPYTNHGREAIFADFNGDKRIDLFITDHGYDALPNTGDQNVLVLSRGKKGFFNATKRLPKIMDMSHGVGAGDADGDKDIDLFVVQTPGPKVPPYFLENRKGKFIRVPEGKWLDKSLSNMDQTSRSQYQKKNLSYTAGIEDIDGDGQTDLILTAGKHSSSHNSRIVFGKKGKFLKANVVNFPASRFKNQSISTHYVAEDLDGNGLKDLILVYNRFPSGKDYQGMSFQVMLQTKKRKFKNKTARYFPGGLHYPTGHWCWWLFLVDLNNDKRKDLVCSTLTYMQRKGIPDRPTVFLRQKNGQFKPVRPSNLSGGEYWTLGGLLPVDIDKDGDIELIGFKNVWENGKNTGKWTIQVVELTTKKVSTQIID